jgi:hypothetical protein
MSLRLLTENETAEFVMPARLPGIQARKDAFGDVHVRLDSSAPCWNDAIDGFCLTDRLSPLGCLRRTGLVEANTCAS